MKKTLLLSIFVLCSTMLRAQSNVAEIALPCKEWFQSMPDSLLPLINDNARQALTHAYELRTPALTTDAMGTELKLDTLTNEYLCLRTSEISTLQLRLLHTTDSVSLIAAIRTVMAPAHHSTISFYNAQWQQLFWVEFPYPTVQQFIGESTEAQRVAAQFRQMPLIEITASPSDTRFTLTLSTDELDSDGRELAKKLNKQLVLEWNGEEFVFLTEENKIPHCAFWKSS